jgi:chemosensory pili system protein ChpB (putative protein-glutamate methylesterase)
VSSLRVGVIVDDPAQVSALRSVVASAGQEMAIALEFEKATDRIADAGADAWVVNLNVETLEATQPELLDQVLDSIHVPMILCEGSIPNQVSPEFGNWQRRLLLKLRSLDGDINRASRDSPPVPRSVWVLAGSVGGPESVKQFLELLPPSLGIAFIYANHIEKDFQAMLTQVMGKNSHYDAYAPKHGCLLYENSVAIISPDFVTSVGQDGSFNVRSSKWHGQYKPNLDQVVATTAVHFGKIGGVIVFSGMCDDSAAACRIMRRCGGQVWAQTRESCVSWAMPEAAKKAVGELDFTGTPSELASRLVLWAAVQQRHQDSMQYQSVIR